MWGVARCCLPRSAGQPQHLKYQNRIWYDDELKYYLACIHCVSSLSRVSFCVFVFYYMFTCVRCVGLIIVLGKWLALLMTPLCDEVITSTKPRWKRLFMCIFYFVWFVYVAVCPQPFTICMPMARYSQFVLKVPLNTKQPNHDSIHYCDWRQVWHWTTWLVGRAVCRHWRITGMWQHSLR